MMEVSVAWLITLPVGASIVLIILCWAYCNIRDAVRFAPPSVRARIYRCEVCTHVYVDARDVPLSRCKRCGCLNEAIKR